MTAMTTCLQPVLRLKLQEPYFSLVKAGKKTIEGRIYEATKFSKIKAGKLIEFYNPQKPEFSFTAKVVKIKRYTTFEELLTKEGLQKCLPLVTSLEEGLKVYYSFPGFKEEEKKNGVIALTLKV